MLCGVICTRTFAGTTVPPLPASLWSWSSIRSGRDGAGMCRVPCNAEQTANSGHSVRSYQNDWLLPLSLPDAQRVPSLRTADRQVKYNHAPLCWLYLRKFKGVGPRFLCILKAKRHRFLACDIPILNITHDSEGMDVTLVTLWPNSASTLPSAPASSALRFGIKLGAYFGST